MTQEKIAKYRNTASFGKRQEYVAVAELLRRNFDVYMPLVDDQGIDCVIRLDTVPTLYIDIQIKARSKDIANPGYFPHLAVKTPRDNYFFVLYDEGLNLHWVIPSLDVVKLGNLIKSGAHSGKYSVKLINKKSRNKRPKFAEYEMNFDLLRMNGHAKAV